MINDKILIVSSDYPISLNQIMMANLVIIIWTKNVIPKENGYLYEDGITPISPYFTIKKNRWGNCDESIHIPIELLSNVLENPSGKLDWVK